MLPPDHESRRRKFAPITLVGTGAGRNLRNTYFDGAVVFQRPALRRMVVVPGERKPFPEGSDMFLARAGIVTFISTGARLLVMSNIRKTLFTVNTSLIHWFWE